MMSNSDKPKITQDVIRLYDEFTHGTMSRRSFISRLSLLTGSTAAAMACLPLLQNDYSALAGEMTGIVTGEATYDADVPVTGFLARPEGEGPWPAVVVIHENRGLNPHIESVAARAAKEGFLAFAPNMLSPYGGTPADQDAARNMIYEIDYALATARLKAGLAFLRGHEASTGKTGAVGFCWGGGQVCQLAVNDPELDAGVVYYGSQPEAADVAKIEAPLLLNYAGLDERINAGIPAFEEALKAAGKDYTIHVYDGVNHAFNNDTNAARYDEAAATLAWSRTIAFFREHLA